MKETFTRKIGPLPMWAWLAIIGAVVVGWAWYKDRKTSASSTASDTADASQVPQFVNQVSTTVQPPSAPTTTSSSAGDGVSRSHRSPKVRHQINQIHKENTASKDKGTASSTSTTAKAGTDVHKATATKKAPAKKAPSRNPGPVRRG